METRKTVMMVRSKVNAESAVEVETAISTMFGAIEDAQPRGVRYASCILPDGVTYVAMLELEDGIENPLPSIPAFRELLENLKNWRDEPPVVEQLTVVGSYQLF